MIPDRLYWDKNFREGQSRSSLQCEENRNSEIKKRKKKKTNNKNAERKLDKMEHLGHCQREKVKVHFFR